MPNLYATVRTSSSLVALMIPELGESLASWIYTYWRLILDQFLQYIPFNFQQLVSTFFFIIYLFIYF